MGEHDQTKPSRPGSAPPAEGAKAPPARFPLWRIAEGVFGLLWWLTRALRLNRLYVWWMGLSPPLLFVVSFAALIAAGTAGLMWLPGLTARPLAPLDALFTVTSAVCVTGLTVADTAGAFTRWGQAWLLLFIQLGGLGVFTLSTLIIGSLVEKLSLRTEVLVGAPVELAQRRSVVALMAIVVRFTLTFEAAGAVLLYVQWIGDYGPADGAWHAAFHSVSAFCSAGFTILPNGLMGQAERPGILLPLTVLSIAGSFGFLSIEEAARWWRLRKPDGQPRPRLSSHTFASAVVTAALLVGGAALFAVFEWRGVLGGFSVADKLTNAWTMAAMRTSGFNAVAYTDISNASAYLTVMLMFVGGAPGSTAGGIKTTALAILVALAVSRIRGRRYVTLHGRTLPEATVQRTVSLTMVAFALLVAALFVLSYSEVPAGDIEAGRRLFLPHLFELASALGTAGLSMGVTPGLSAVGKVLVIGLMFVGRVGPLAFFAAISVRAADVPGGYRLAREDVIVG